MPTMFQAPTEAQRVTLWYQLIFLVTGVLSTLGNQYLHYRGAADGRSLLTVLVTYLGMVATVLVPMQRPHVDAAVAPIMHKGVLLIAAMDVLGNLVLTVGQFSVGSGLFQIIYASILVWSAVFSRIFLGRGLSWAQWGAILMIMAGLCVNAVGGQATTSNKATDDRVFAGFFITLLGTCIYSGVYTLNDYMLSGVKRPMSPQQQCLWVGLYSTIVCLLVMTVISVPTLRSMPLENPQVILMYLALIVSALGHNLTYFLLMESTGAVATGVLQALRAVLVFGLSHYFYCEQDEVQCFNISKGFATAIVVIGVIGFSVAKARRPSSGKGKFDRISDKDDLEHDQLS